MKKLFFLIAVFGYGALLPMSALAELKLSADRDENSLELGKPESDDEDTVLIGLQDCVENIDVEFTVTENNGSSTGNLYLVVGSDCKGDTDSSLDCDTYEVSTGLQRLEIQDILEVEDDEECEGADGTSVWLARLKSTSKHSQEDTWSESVTIDVDMDAPDPPKGISLGIGNEKVEVKWDHDDSEDTESNEKLDEDVYKIVILYEAVGTTTSSTGDNSTDDDDGSDEADSATGIRDAGVTADAGVSTSLAVFRAPLSNRETDEEETDDDDDDDDLPCEAGIFESGAEYSDDFANTKDVNTPRSGKKEVGGLTNGTRYRFALIAVDKHSNSSVLSEVKCITPNETEDFLKEYLDSGGKVGEFCFVATAAFGSYDHPVVKALRIFRDHFLAKVPGGDLMIATYYELGPQAAAVVSDHPALRKGAQILLALIAGVALPMGMLGPWGMLMLSLALLSGGLLISLSTARRAERPAARRDDAGLAAPVQEGATPPSALGTSDMGPNFREVVLRRRK